MAQPPEKPNEPERSVAPYPVKAYIYKYADSNWKDKLTSIETHIVDSSGNMAQETVMNLTYDAMGNPTNYLGANLTWRGKQLTGYSKTGTSVTYAYNEDGLRTQKTHNGTITDYYYNGSVLIGMQSGNITQRFSYDAQGKVVAVDYSENGGSSYTTYYYLRNAQGDIVKLIDNGGDTKVEYTYDSWGKVLATTGSLATTLGENQPFRYRGYVYDSDTNLYYLQSRYYNPSLGRFISSDVYLSTGQGVLGHNSYAYCRNNPTNRKDTNGNTDDELWPDYTEELIELLINNYCKAQLWSIVPSYAQIKFYNYVKSRGKWDYKANPPDWMPSDKKFSAFGCNMTAADLGNLNYGMTGMVVGFSRQTLLTAGGFVAVTEDGDSNGILYYYDGKDDYFFINLGITLCEAINPLYALSSTTFDLSLNMGLNGRAGLAVYKKTRKLISSTWKNTSLLPILLPF